MKIERHILRIIGLWMALLSPFALRLSPLSAQTSVLSIGVRGGGQTFLPATTVGAKNEVKPAIGAAGTIDIRYTFYGNISDRFGLGFALGAGIGYGSAGLKGSNTDSYSNTDYLGKQIDYTVTSDFAQTNRFAKADVALLLALSFGKVTVNIGPRLMIPFAATGNLKISAADIDAYYSQYDVHVVNKLITGILETPYEQQTTTAIPNYNLLLAAEAGYEWALTGKSRIGLQFCLEYAVWNNFTPDKSGSKAPLVEVQPITDADNPVPAVSVHEPNVLISDLPYLSFGLRVYYAFSTGSADKNTLRPTKDSRYHHNRYLR